MSRDLRRYTSQTTFRLIVGAVILLFVVGFVGTWLIYGLSAAVMALLCLLGALVPIGLIALFIFGMDWIVKRVNKD
jgi:magnesium-transporting ATPase (P-type)